MLGPDRANLLIGRELAARRLRERLGGFLGRERDDRLVVLAGKLQYEARNLVLYVRWKVAGRLDSAFEQFGHGTRLLRSRLADNDRRLAWDDAEAMQARRKGRPAHLRSS